MSRWWPEPVGVLVGAPASVDGDPTLSAAPLQTPVTRPDRALLEFTRRLDALDLPPRTRLNAWLGHDVARLLMLPWQPTVASPSAHEAYARHGFGEVYGPVAHHWRVRVSPGPYGQPSLACAVAVEVFERLEQIVVQRQLKLAGAQPLLAEAVRRHRGALRAADGWFVVTESDWLTLLQLQHGQPLSVRTVAAAEQPLPRLLMREMRLSGSDVANGSVWLVTCASPPPARADAPTQALAAALQAQGWRLHALGALADAADSTPQAALRAATGAESHAA